MTECTCTHCGYVWHSRVKRPKSCPKCRSYRWDEPVKSESGSQEPEQGDPVPK